MEANEIKIGQEIYYRGDMANAEGFGKITEVIRDKWGDFFSTKLEDGREQKRIPCIMLAEIDTDNGMTRFCTKEAYNKKRQEKIDKFLRFANK